MRSEIVKSGQRQVGERRRETERDIQRQRETERDRERQRGRYRVRQTDIQIDRQTERDREKDRDRGREKDRDRKGETERMTERQTEMLNAMLHCNPWTFLSVQIFSFCFLREEKSKLMSSFHHMTTHESRPGIFIFNISFLKQISAQPFLMVYVPGDSYHRRFRFQLLCWP